MRIITVLFCVGFAQTYANLPLLSDLVSSLPRMIDLFGAYKSKEVTWAKSGVRTCKLAPEFIKTPDCIIQQVTSGKVFSDPQYSVFLPPGAVTNAGAFHCKEARHAVLTITKVNDAYQAQYWYGDGYLVSEKPPPALVGTNTAGIGHPYAIQQAFESIVLGKEFVLEYNWGETCDALNNKVKFSYTFGGTKRFEGYQNEVKMIRTMAGSQVEIRDAFLVAAPQKFSVPRHMTAVVSMSPGDNCDIDFFAIYSDVNEYFPYLDAYAQKYFNVTLDRKAAQDMLDANRACSKECEKSDHQ